jgi:hypothetical protein
MSDAEFDLGDTNTASGLNDEDLFPFLLEGQQQNPELFGPGIEVSILDDLNVSQVNYDHPPLDATAPRHGYPPVFQCSALRFARFLSSPVESNITYALWTGGE